MVLFFTMNGRHVLAVTTVGKNGMISQLFSWSNKNWILKLANLAAANKYYRLVGMSMEWTHFLELSERKWSQLL